MTYFSLLLKSCLPLLTALAGVAMLYFVSSSKATALEWQIVCGRTFADFRERY